jgi:hypothetical protein
MAGQMDGVFFEVGCVCDGYKPELTQNNKLQVLSGDSGERIFLADFASKLLSSNFDCQPSSL